MVACRGDDVQIEGRGSRRRTSAVAHGFAVGHDHRAQCPSFHRVDVRNGLHFERHEFVDLVVHAMVVNLAWGQVEVCDLSDFVVVVEQFGVGGTSSDVLVFVSGAGSCLDSETIGPGVCRSHGCCSSVQVDVTFWQRVPDLNAHDSIRGVLYHHFSVAGFEEGFGSSVAGDGSTVFRLDVSEAAEQVSVAEHGADLGGLLESGASGHYAWRVDVVRAVLQLVGYLGNQSFRLAEDVVYGFRARTVGERACALVHLGFRRRTETFAQTRARSGPQSTFRSPGRARDARKAHPDVTT